MTHNELVRTKIQITTIHSITENLNLINRITMSEDSREVPPSIIESLDSEEDDSEFERDYVQIFAYVLVKQSVYNLFGFCWSFTWHALNITE